MSLRPGDRQLIKEWNEGLVLETIRRHEPLTRTEISERTGLGRSTITVITGRLLRRGLIEESGSVETADAGRRPSLLRLQARARSVLGFKLGPTEVTAAALDLHAQICAVTRLPLGAGGAPDRVIAAIAAAAHMVMEQAKPDLGPAIGAGLVMPGVVNQETGASINPYFPAWGNLPFRQRLEEALGIPVLVDNDANAFALAESCYGAGRGCETVLCLTVGIGIGAGVIIGGRLHRGNRSGAGEIGHALVDPQGPPCGCGRRGCLEALAADNALLRRTGRSREQLVQAAWAGESQALELLIQTGQMIGAALANAANLISPDLVVVGGEAAEQAGPLLLAPMWEAMQAYALPILSDVNLVPAELGADAWVKGAAALVLQEAFQVPLHRNDTDTMIIARRMSSADRG